MTEDSSQAPPPASQSIVVPLFQPQTAGLVNDKTQSLEYYYHTYKVAESHPAWRESDFVDDIESLPVSGEYSPDDHEPGGQRASSTFSVAWY
jgi:hypothetical protein